MGSTGAYLHTSKQTHVFFPSQNTISQKKKRSASCCVKTPSTWHAMSCTGENISWNAVSRPDKIPGQYPHMRPPLPVKGLCIDGDDDLRPSSPRQRRTLQSDSRMDSMGEIGGRFSTVRSWWFVNQLRTKLAWSLIYSVKAECKVN